MNQHFEVEAKKYSDTFVVQRVDMRVSKSAPMQYATRAKATEAARALQMSGYSTRIAKVTREFVA